MLAPDVRLRSRIVADQDCAEPWRAASPGELGYPACELLADGLGRCLAVQNCRTHRALILPGEACGPRLQSFARPDLLRSIRSPRSPFWHQTS